MNRIEELEAEVARLRERVAALEEALRPFARVCDIIPVDDGDAAVQTVVYGTISLSAGQFRAARAVFQGDAPKEERCHVWGGDVSRWELPEIAPTGNAGDPGARMKCCASCRWMSLSWADRILLGRSAAICTHPKTGRQDPVSGQIIGQGARCSLVRQGRLPRIDGDSCGPEGRWWEATE